MPDEVSLVVTTQGLTALADMALASKSQSRLDERLARTRRWVRKVLVVDDVRADVQVIQMNLAEGIHGVRVESIGSPQWQAGIHATAVEFRTGGSIEQKQF